MQNPKTILNQYWGFDNFRPLQEEIINSILNGQDTLALLPTGGGKSICFQVPALCKDGICIVVSPLIALMHDQVDNLKRRGIPAIAITSAMRKRELDIALDNCVYGKIKFLYLSPERLQTELARVRIGKMKVNMIAVDEAHCISQWGYDFRPPYLQVADLREICPDVPVLALTATAIPKVVTDIQEQLLFKTKNVFQSSFVRSNLAYTVKKTEDKISPLIKLSQQTEGSGIVYARSRRKTMEVATLLSKNNVAATFYHAGLSPEERTKRQKQWLTGECKVIVATNAFGMGIDKSDVRFVVHLDLPDSPEAYFQEAGRAGRDGKPAAALLFYNPKDIDDLERNFEASFPPLSEIKRTYQALSNMYEVPVGSGAGMTLIFDQEKLCKTYKLEAIKVFHSLNFLEKEGYIAVNDAVFTPARLKMITNNETLYRFQVENPKLEGFIKSLLRMYAGLFDEYVRIVEKDIAKRASMTELEVKRVLKDLEQRDLLNYIPQNDRPLFTFLLPRVDAKKLYIAPEHLIERKKITSLRIKAMISYISGDTVCRQAQLLAYFGELNVEHCGVCDSCIKKTSHNKKISRDVTTTKLVKLLSSSPKKIAELNDLFPEISTTELTFIVRQLLDAGRIKFNTKRQLTTE
ncbi:MAG: RecQ family ATP-dependent DNA helicase [Bacteroidetes bacterium]|nr:RecQ family ATP-dependent DNA helicase [Bacteroidota bacterium]PHX82647.1 MAG: recombinase RecQ [Flavobacteriales bacterium]